jgi:ribose transport system substrate-binding protein
VKKRMFLLLAATFLAAVPLFPEGALTIGISLQLVKNPFMAAMKAAVQKTAAELGVNVLIADAQAGQNRQDLDLRGFIEKKVDAVIVTSMMYDGLVPALERTVAAGIPVATVDCKVNSRKVLFHAGVDNRAVGEAAALYIIKELSDTGTVLELAGAPLSWAAMERRAGFEQTIQQSHVKLLGSDTGVWDREIAYMVMRGLINAHPDFDAVFAANCQMMVGAIRAMEDAGVDPSSKVTFTLDLSRESLECIKKGTLRTTLNLRPGEQMRRALTAMVDYLRNGNRPENDVICVEPGLCTSRAERLALEDSGY